MLLVMKRQTVMWIKLTKVKGRLLLDVVIRKSAPVFELLSGKDEALLVGGNAVLRAND